MDSGRFNCHLWATMRFFTPLMIGVLFFGSLAKAAVPSSQISAPSGLSASSSQSIVKELSLIRTRIISQEKQVLSALTDEKQAKERLKRLKELLALQEKEKGLLKQRKTHLEKVVEDLNSRKALIQARIQKNGEAMRGFLIDLKTSLDSQPKTLGLPESEAWEAPRREVLARLVNRQMASLEALRTDLADAENLEKSIFEERQELAYMIQDLKEKEGLLAFHHEIQVDLIKKRSLERAEQLQKYRNLKSAESQVEQMIDQFNARLEIAQVEEAQNERSKALSAESFLKRKGTLKLPVEGKIVSTFGRAFDSISSLYVFKKGIDIAVPKLDPVRAISSGRVVFAGILPRYGPVAIIDHGEKYYSLCAHLGEIHKNAGDWVAEREVIGLTDGAGTPIYFEIRARNVAVNPLQWVSN